MLQQLDSRSYHLFLCNLRDERRIVRAPPPNVWKHSEVRVTASAAGRLQVGIRTSSTGVAGVICLPPSPRRQRTDRD